MAHEITDQSPAEVLQGLLDGLGDGVILTDTNERVIYINREAVRILDCKDKMSGAVRFSDICPLQFLHTGVPFGSPLQKAAELKHPVGLAKDVGILRGPLQEFVYLSATCSPMEHEDGGIAGFTVILRDVTHMRHMEMKIEADHACMRAVFAAARVGLCVIDASGTIVDINETGLETMQITYHEAIGKQFGDAFLCENSIRNGCGNGAECPHCSIRKNILKSIRIEGYTNAITAAMHSRRSEEPVWLKLFFSQSWTHNSRQIIITMVDISQRKRREDALEEAKKQAEEASRTKSQFLANMSHEIRTPINGMNGMIDLTLRTELTEEQRENLLSAKQCSEDLLRVINDILDFSKLECGKMEMERLDFDLPKTIRRVSKIHGKVARGKGLDFQDVHYCSLPHYVKGDPMRLRQILHNLLSNAIKFTSEGSISLKAEAGTENGQPVLKFTISDTGIGMSKEEQKKLFKPFSQVDGSTTRKFGGTGLGLMVVKELIQAMKGDISVTSEPGKGSTFNFWIPLEEAEGESEDSCERTVFINPKWQQAESKEEAKEEPVQDDSDIASLLAYCEQKLDEEA